MLRSNSAVFPLDHFVSSSSSHKPSPTNANICCYNCGQNLLSTWQSRPRWLWWAHKVKQMVDCHRSKNKLDILYHKANTVHVKYTILDELESLYSSLCGRTIQIPNARILPSCTPVSCLWPSSISSVHGKKYSVQNLKCSVCSSVL